MSWSTSRRQPRAAKTILIKLAPALTLRTAAVFTIDRAATSCGAPILAEPGGMAGGPADAGRLLATHADLARKLEALAKKYDAQFKVVFEAIRQLMAPPPSPPRGRTGFPAKPE